MCDQYWKKKLKGNSNNSVTSKVHCSKTISIRCFLANTAKDKGGRQKHYNIRAYDEVTRTIWYIVEETFFDEALSIFLHLNHPLMT